MVIVKSGTCPVESNGRSNIMFTSKMTSLQDDAGESIGPIDFSRKTYQELVKLFTTPFSKLIRVFSVFVDFFAENSEPFHAFPLKFLLFRVFLRAW